jgi:FixJ family two-component response regulator
MEVVVEARRLGAKDFVVKPCDSARLLAAIDRMLG